MVGNRWVLRGASAENGSQEKNPLGVMKHKTTLGLGRGHTPKEEGARGSTGRVPVGWKLLSRVEVERREVEVERASRSVAISAFLSYH